MNNFGEILRVGQTSFSFVLTFVILSAAKTHINVKTKNTTNFLENNRKLSKHGSQLARKETHKRRGN